MNFKKIKKDFSILQTEMTPGKPLVYLDNGATTQKPQSVIDAVTLFYQSYNSNTRRGLYPIGERATKEFEDARTKVATFINAKHTEEIIFTKGTTDGINFIAQSWAFQHLQPNHEILITQAEHHANLLPWQRIVKQTGASLRFIPVNKKTFTLDYSDELITSKTKLIAITHSSNVLGNIWGKNLDRILNRAHEVGAKVLLDGAQTIIHQKIDIQVLNVDFFVFSGHKMLAPTGVGVLYIKKNLLDAVEPYQLGGSMVHSVTFETAKWDKAPQKFEAGTAAISSVIGLGAAIDYINNNINFDLLAQHESSLCKALIKGLKTINNVFIVGNIDIIKKNGHLVCFTVKDIHPHDIADYLGQQGIAVRAGHHCAQPLVNLLLGESSLIRVSFSIYNTMHDVDYFLLKLSEAISFFKRYL